MSLEAIIVILIICGVIGLIIGSSKDASLDGFLYGLFLGPLGIIFIFVFHGNLVKCSFCQKYINRNAIKCPYCQSELKKIENEE